MNKSLSKSLLIGTLWSFIGRFGYLLVGLITNIVLVRLLSPKEFGQIAIVMFFIIIANVISESGLSGALVRKQDIKNIDYSTVFIFNLGISIMLVMLLVSSSGFIANFYNDSQLEVLLIVSSSVVFINAFKVTQTARLIIDLKFKEKAKYDFLAIFLASLIAITSAYAGVGVWALVIFQLLISLISTILLWFFVGPLREYKFSITSFKQVYKFGMYTTLATLLNSIFDNIYQLILGRFFSIAQTGYYYQAKNLQSVPSNIVVMLSSGPVYSVLSKLQDSPIQFNRMYKEITRFFTIIVGFLSVISFFYADLIVSLLYGDRWLDSAYYIKLLIISSFFYVQEMFNRNIFKIFDKTEKIFQLEIIKKIIQLITISYGLWVLSIEVLLYGYILTSIISFFINYFYANRVKEDIYSSGLSDIIKIAFVCLVTTFSSNYFLFIFDFSEINKVFIFPFLIFVYFSLLCVLRVVNLRQDSKGIYNLFFDK